MIIIRLAKRPPSRPSGFAVAAPFIHPELRIKDCRSETRKGARPLERKQQGSIEGQQERGVLAPRRA